MPKLSERRLQVVNGVAAGLSWRAAAKAAGYSDAYSKVAKTRMMRDPAIKEAIDSVRAEGRQRAVYDLAQAMADAEDAAIYAKSQKSAMALVQARTLKSKLGGFLIDHVQIEQIDMSGALERARTRIINPPMLLTDAPGQGIEWPRDGAKLTPPDK